MLPPWVIDQQKRERRRRNERPRPALHIEAPRPTVEDYLQDQEGKQEQRDEQGRVIIDFTL